MHVCVCVHVNICLLILDKALESALYPSVHVDQRRSNVCVCVYVCLCVFMHVGGRVRGVVSVLLKS